MTDPLVAESCHTTACRSGVVRYMAPEQVNPGLFGSEARNPQKAIDVHSFAMIAYEVRLPYAMVNGDVMQPPTYRSSQESNHSPESPGRDPWPYVSLMAPGRLAQKLEPRSSGYLIKYGTC